MPFIHYGNWLFLAKAIDFSGEYTPPTVSIVFAAYNESSIIEDKIRSLYHTNYPIDLLSVWIGSDMSDDGTDAIIRSLQKEFPNLNLNVNEARSGKSATINRLVALSSAEVIIATDANILFKETTIEELVRPIAQEKATAVAGTLKYEDKGVASSTASNEKAYLSLENAIRRAESRKHGICLGMEGGLYSMKKAFWQPIPPNTFMEDFFQTVQLISRDQKVLFNESAVGLEDVSTSLQEEYKRKIRISIGNWQNLVRFYPLIFKHPLPVRWTIYNAQSTTLGDTASLSHRFSCRAVYPELALFYRDACWPSHFTANPFGVGLGHSFSVFLRNECRTLYRLY
jgi:cellulose synthase/poly-beta-1,6-N-acetylglucosamine synthase-like glycosyltransferase